MFAAEAVNDTRAFVFTLVIVNGVKKLMVGLLRFLFNFVVKILAIEARDIDFGIVEAKLLDNVRTHALCGGGGECGNGYLRIALFELE